MTIPIRTETHAFSARSRKRAVGGHISPESPQGMEQVWRNIAAIRSEYHSDTIPLVPIMTGNSGP